MASRLELVRIEEARHALAMSELALESESFGGGSMSCAEAGAWTNLVCGIGLDGSVAPESWQHVLGYYASRQVEHSVSVAMHADASVFDGLARAGYACIGVEGVHAIALESLGELAAARDHSAGVLEFRAVDASDVEDVESFCDVSVRGFLPEGHAPSELDLALTRRVALHPRSRLWIAFWDGKPCGATGLECHAGHACLWGTSVWPAFRRRGIQAAMLAHRLRVAREQGCGYAFMHASPGHTSERQAARVGMELVYSKLVFRPPA